jgi:hypothetical protein
MPTWMWTTETRTAAGSKWVVIRPDLKRIETNNLARAERPRPESGTTD